MDINLFLQLAAFLGVLAEVLALVLEIKQDIGREQVIRERIRLKVRDLREGLDMLELRARDLVETLHQADWQPLSDDRLEARLHVSLDACLSLVRELEDCTAGRKAAKACFDPVAEAKGAASDLVEGVERAYKRTIYKAIGSTLSSLGSIHDCLARYSAPPTLEGMMPERLKRMREPGEVSSLPRSVSLPKRKPPTSATPRESDCTVQVREELPPDQAVPSHPVH